jgi:hypothetical protein
VSMIKVKGQEVRVGDDLWFLGKPHRITRIEGYIHPVVTRGEEWRIAYSDGPDAGGKNAWGITLEYEHGYAAGYLVSAWPGDNRAEVRPPAGDYLSPHYGEGAVLYEQYAAEGSPGLWRDWLKARKP